MKKEIIEKIFDEAITKCGRVSTRASVEKAFHKIAEKYGFGIKKQGIQETDYPKPANDGLNYDPVYTLYDKKHNTELVFTEKFLDDNQVAYNPQGNHTNHSITLDEIIDGYLKLPTNNKDSVNKILFKYLGDKEDENVDTNTLAFSNFTDVSANEMNVITVPSYYFDVYNPTGNDWDNYDFLLAHESMHCLDYLRLSEREYNINKKEVTTHDLTPTEYKIWYQLNAFPRNIMDKSNGSYQKAITDNINYLKDNEVANYRLPHLNSASTYGATDVSEDFAEAGAMVMLGFHNPDNLRAVVRWDGATMQYREWIKLHPYKAQYLIKELYGEDVSVDTLLGQSVNTIKNLLPTDD